MSNEHRLVNIDELNAMGWPFTRSMTERMIAKGRFPRPARYWDDRGNNSPRWRLSDVVSLLRKPFLSRR